jgi:4-hydroxybenzoyl-CoA reductase subunit beta
MLRLPGFSYRRAGSVSEAARALEAEGAAEGRARLVAGGTDLFPNLKRRHQRAEVIVGIAAVPELLGVTVNGELGIGAATLLSTVEHHAAVVERYPALAAAVAAISSPPLRNMGTLGGNLCVDTRCTYYNQTEEWRRSIDYCMKEQGEVCWVAPSSPRCWAHSASDAAPVLAALRARVVLASTGGERTLAVEELFHDDGIAYLAKGPEEVLTRVLLPAASAAGRCRSAFVKLRRRGSIDFAVLSVGAAVWTDEGGTVTDARVFLGAVASRPVSAEAAARALVGQRLTPEVITSAAALARRSATPMDNTDFQAQWRGAVVAKYVEAALLACAGADPGVRSTRP